MARLLASADRWPRYSPVGIRFWDPVLDIPVTDGLAVTAQPDDGRGRTVTAIQGGSGVYSFINLPGLTRAEFPGSEAELAASPPVPEHTFRIEVKDAQGRFLPLAFRVDLPLAGSGLLTDEVFSSMPGYSPKGFYLFSAPTRKVRAGMALLQGQLWDAGTDQAAGYAALEVEVSATGEIWYGLADERGCIAVMFPYPNVKSTPVWSEGGGGPPDPSLPRTPLYENSWEIQVRVRYEPQILEHPGDDPERVPYLESVTAQRQGRLQPVRASPAAGQWTTSVRFGQELILCTDGISRLLIQSGS